MKRIIFSALTCLALFASLSVSAQNVAINATGATPDPSAMLDVNATNAGLLVPRVALASLNDAATIVNPATSLLVYNSGTVLTAGYYYNSGTPAAPVWTMLATGSGSYWSSLDGTNIYNTTGGAVNIGNSTALSNGIQNIYSDGSTGYFGVTYYQTPGTGTGASEGFVVGQNDFSSNIGLVWNFADAPIYFGTNGAAAAVISGNGNAGIGSFAPVAKTEITAFGTTNNTYTTYGLGFPDVTGLSVYSNDSATGNEKNGVYSFIDSSSLENNSIYGDAGSSAAYNVGVIGLVALTPSTNTVFSNAIEGVDDVNASNTYAGYFSGKVLTYGNTSIYGSSAEIAPSTNWIGFDASTYSSNTAADASFSDAGVLGYATGSTSNINSGIVGIGGSTALNIGVAGLAADGPAGTNIGILGNVLNGADYAGLFQGGNVTVEGSSIAIQPTTSVISFDAATYSSNTSGDDSVSETGILGYAEGGTSTFNVGVTGIGGSTATNVGLVGVALDGIDGSNIGILAQANENADDLAGEFFGNVSIDGTLSATGTKNFQIDHPLDPANKILRHAAIESNEVLDMYSGNTTTDGNGYATVQLPAYFETINKDFRYQLTVMGTFAQAIVKQKISSNQFIIQTNQPNVEVSWQVAGVRNDKQMQAHPFVAEESKTSRQTGKYFQPELYGQPASAGIAYMLKSNGKIATGTHRTIPSLKAVAGSAHVSANSTKPVSKGGQSSALSNSGLKKSMTGKAVAPSYPANSLLGKAAQAKAAANNTSTPKK